MKFISIYPNLSVVLRPKKKLIDETTGATVFNQAGITVKFSMGLFETNDEEIIVLLLEKIDDMKRRGLPPSFSVYPGSENEIAQSNTKSDVEIKDKIILDLETELQTAQKQIAELKEQVAKFSQKKNNKKLVSTDNQT